MVSYYHDFYTACSIDQCIFYQDQRNIPALGRIGDPDDIIASVLVEDSKANSSQSKLVFHH